MTRSRAGAVLRAAWTYTLRTLERPTDIPRVVRNVVVERAHLGETLNAARFARWLRYADIRTVIDVGAHTGEFASGLRGVLPDCTIHSFEPQQDAFEALTRRMAAYSGVHVYRTALGSSPGTATFHRNAFTKASSLLPISDMHRQAFGWTDAGTPIEVPVDTLDNALDLGGGNGGRVLLKLDVQGFELEVLRGAVRTLPAIDHVLVETSVGGPLYEREATFDDVYRFLADRGFRFTGIWDQMRDPRNDTPLQVDALFGRRR